MRETRRFDGGAGLWLFRSALAGWAVGSSAALPAADTGIAVQLDADWVTWIRAQRRAQGLDAPDPVADAQFRLMLQRLQRSRDPAQNGAGRVERTDAAAARYAGSRALQTPALRAVDAACERAADAGCSASSPPLP